MPGEGPNNADSFSFAENLASSYTISSQGFVDVNEPVARAVYAWLYDDKADTNGSYGHRNFILAVGLVENSGEENKEGLLSIAVATEEITLFDDGKLYRSTTYTVMNAFDPNAHWPLSDIESVDLIKPDCLLSFTKLSDGSCTSSPQ